VLPGHRFAAACRDLYYRLTRVRFSEAQQARKMEHDWNQRARENARHFIATANTEWTDDEFYASGERNIDEWIRNDMENVCRGKAPRSMRVLEIGCGAGRLTRALAGMFGEVHAVDVSGEMVQLARSALRDCPNVHVYQNNGMDLSVVPGIAFDFAFSALVFQHIPSYPIIRNYVREVNRLLAPGALFKFQVRGNTKDASGAMDTWVGLAIADEEAVALAEESGFEPRYRVGAGTLEFWLWFFKR